jgi:hypothetical protein
MKLLFLQQSLEQIELLLNDYPIGVKCTYCLAHYLTSITVFIDVLSARIDII